MAQRDIPKLVKKGFSVYRKRYKRSPFKDWPFRTLQGNGGRALILTRLLIAVRDRSEDIWNALWDARAKAKSYGADAREQSKIALDTLAAQDLPATKQWSAFLALERVRELGTATPYNSDDYCLPGPNCKLALQTIFPSLSRGGYQQAMHRLFDAVPTEGRFA